MLADADSCDRDDDEADEGVADEELAVLPGTTNGSSFDVAINFLVIFDEMCFLTAFPVIRVICRISPMKALREFLGEAQL